MASRCYTNDPCKWMVDAIRACANEQAMPLKFEVKAEQGDKVVWVIAGGVVTKVVACPACGHNPNAVIESARWSRFSGGVTATPYSGSCAAPMRGAMVDNNPERIYGESR